MSSHHLFIHKTFSLARKAKGKTSPNPMVGCVIVKNGRIIGQGYHQKCGHDHAEIAALKKCGNKSRGAILYVNLEPCYHFGRTPPCVDAVIKSGVKEVVIAMRDPNPRTNGKSVVKLRKAGIKVVEHVLEKDALKLNEVFIKNMKSRMPFVVAKTAQTIDGKIALKNGESKWITSEEARRFSRAQRDSFDAILVGINTVVKDNPRLNGVSKKNLKKIILDSELRISLRARLFKETSMQDIFIATTNKAGKAKLSRFKEKGVNVVLCPQKKGKIDLRWLLKKLFSCGITSVLIEGGAKTVGSALQAGLVDKMHIYIAPKIIGEQGALSSIDGMGIRRIHQALSLEDVVIKKLGKDIFVEAYVYRNH